MACTRCKGKRILEVSAKCSDMCCLSYADLNSDGYVPHDIGIGGGDYIDLSLCMDCGQVQGAVFPVADEAVREAVGQED